jgi:hypothetical protein
MKKIPFIKKQLNVSVLAFVMGLSVTSYAYANHSTYLGADAVYGSTKFKQDYGANIFSKKPAPGLNLFVGHMFNENFGAELGFEVYKKMKRTETIAAGNTVAGVFLNPDPISGINSISYDTHFKQRHPYIGAIAKTNILGDNNFVSLMLGVSMSHIEAKYNKFATNTGPLSYSPRTFSRTKPIGIIRATVEHKFNDHLSLRVLSTWKNTAKFKIKSQENSASSAEVKLKNSFNVGIGATYYI